MKIIVLLGFLVLISACSSTASNPPITASQNQTAQSQIKSAYVRLLFDIDESGKPENIIVVESSHNGLFDQEAIRSLQQWKYDPKYDNGVPVKQKGKKVQLNFEFE